MDLNDPPDKVANHLPFCNEGEVGYGSGASSSSRRRSQRKILRKRKELDALVAQHKRAAKFPKEQQPFSQHILLLSDSEEMTSYSRNEDGDRPSYSYCNSKNILVACCVLGVASIAIVCAITMKLVLSARRDIDNLYARLNAVESSGSELPEKFHDMHLKLQHIEKGESELQNTFLSLFKNVDRNSIEITKLNVSIKELDDRLAGSPELLSLPRDVANVEKSVAAFGSSLKDVNSAIDEVKGMYKSLQQKWIDDTKILSGLRKSVYLLANSTHLPSAQSSSGGVGQTLASVVLSLLKDFRNLSSIVSAVKASQNSYISEADAVNDRMQMEIQDHRKNLSSITERISNAERNSKERIENLSSKVMNITEDLSLLEEKFHKSDTDIHNSDQIKENKFDYSLRSSTLNSIYPTTTIRPNLHPALSKEKLEDFKHSSGN